MRAVMWGVVIILLASLVLAGAGDVNNDGVVNVQDLLFVVQNIHAGSSFNTAADVNGDGVVNIFDLVDVARDFGKTYGSVPFFSDGFEHYAPGTGGLSSLTTTYDPAGSGFSWDPGNNNPGGVASVTVTDAIAHSGNHSLDFFFPGGANGSDSSAEQRLSFGRNLSEVWLSYYIYLPDGTHGLWNRFVHRYDPNGPNNDKFIDIWGSQYSVLNGGGILMGFSTNMGSTGGWIESSWGSDNIVCTGTQIVDIYPSCGTGAGWTPRGSWPNGYLGRWLHVQAHVKLAHNVTASDGSMYLIIDGTVFSNRTGLAMSGRAGYDYLANAYLWGWANSGFSNDTHVFVDDFKIYDTNPGWFASDTTPPVVSGGYTTGKLSAGMTSATLAVTTNENATCRYSTTANTAYGSMTNTFSTTGGTSHFTTVSGLSDGQNYMYYVRCMDVSGNADSSDYAVNFLVANPASALHPHEPAGMTVIGDDNGSVAQANGHAFGITAFGGWTDPSNVVNYTDPTNPVGSGKSVEFHWLSSMSGAAKSFASFTPYHQLYVSFWVYYVYTGTEWQNGQKFFYFGLLNGGRPTYTDFYLDRPASSIPEPIRVVNQNGGAVNPMIDTAYSPPQGTNTKPLVMNQWIHVELLATDETNSSANDGSVYMWVDGKLAGYLDNADWGTGGGSGFAGMEWYAHANSVPVDSIYRIGELYIAGK